jgi:selenocysteine lyase/cysteine desulfurase
MLTREQRAAPSPAVGDPVFAALRAREFARLDGTGLAYLDYTGSALPAARQLRLHNELLERMVFGNPHADSTPSRRSTAALDTARSLLLEHLDADERDYTVCFTANATAAVKLVAESYPFSKGTYLLSADNHNSLNGVREFARRAGARVVYLALDRELQLVDAEESLRELGSLGGRKLFAFPAQSNFSGLRHPLALIDRACEWGWDVLLDAAAFLPSSRLSLREHRPAFVVLSFYKLFGFPTGLGALVVRRDALARLARPWFSGGTVEYVSVQNDLHSLLPDSGAFEDGTPHFLGAAALPAGFALLAEVGMTRLSEHVARLTSMLVGGLVALTHADGTPAARIYGPTDPCARGSGVAFNVVARDGTVVPYWIVEERARANGVAVRAGCFCNPGAAEAAFGFDAATAADCLRAAGEGGAFTVQRFAACMNERSPVAVGAIRASLGLANNEVDVRRAIAVVESFLE